MRTCLLKSKFLWKVIRSETLPICWLWHQWCDQLGPQNFSLVHVQLVFSTEIIIPIKKCSWMMIGLLKNCISGIVDTGKVLELYILSFETYHLQFCLIMDNVVFTQKRTQNLNSTWKQTLKCGSFFSKTPSSNPNLLQLSGHTGQ